MNTMSGFLASQTMGTGRIPKGTLKLTLGCFSIQAACKPGHLTYLSVSTWIISLHLSCPGS